MTMTMTMTPSITWSRERVTKVRIIGDSHLLLCLYCGAPGAPFIWSRHLGLHAALTAARRHEEEFHPDVWWVSPSGSNTNRAMATKVSVTWVKGSA